MTAPITDPPLETGVSEVVGAAEALLTAHHEPPSSRFRLTLRRFARNRLALLGLVGLALMFLLAYIGPHLNKWDYQTPDFLNSQSGPSAEHWFGTDDVGRDLYAQTMVGMQKSLIIGLLVALCSTGTAAVLGTCAAYFGGVTDRLIGWVIDLFQVIPALLILSIMSPFFQGKSWLIMIVLIAAFSWMVTARVVRGMTLTMREREFVRAARYMGVSPAAIIFRHIIPNIASILIVDAALNVGFAISTESFLSFLNFGIRPPDVSLGTVLSAGTQSATTDQYYLFAIPAAFLVAIILFVNFIGDGLRDALDPNSTGASAR